MRSVISDHPLCDKRCTTIGSIRLLWPGLRDLHTRTLCIGPDK
ncbi:MAG: hypothetical protein ACE5F6_05290 [Anaerolineae bacterium]